MDLPELGIGIGIAANLIISGVGWGRLTQKVSDLVDHVKTQNGRVAKLEANEQDCKLNVNLRINTLETEAKVSKQKEYQQRVINDSNSERS